MVTTVTHYSDSRNRAYPGEGFDGVVRVSTGGKFGTGVLLYDGRAVLTAAHIFSQSDSTASILFETVTGTQALSSSKVSFHPDYDPVNENNDLALVWLSAAAPVAAERYALYRGSDEIGQTMTLVGYGLTGTGSSGTSAYNGSILRLKADNQFDTDMGILKNLLGSAMGWRPIAGTQLVADFDDGEVSHDALGNLIRRYDLGLESKEGLIAPGDSGGPAFINGEVAGIASYTARLIVDNINSDIDNLSNSSYGELGAWQRVSVFQQWIDQNLRAQYPNVPARPEEVQKQVVEGNSDTSYAYFLLQFNGKRSDPNQIVSVEYVTRDGTAKAGVDYLAVHGELVLYPNENQAVIPVEIIGDTISESNETFYLDVTYPVGDSFEEDIVKLTAMRTIINDDGGIV